LKLKYEGYGVPEPVGQDENWRIRYAERIRLWMQMGEANKVS